MIRSLIVAIAVSVLLLVLYSWWFQPGWLGTAGYALFCTLALFAVPLCYRFFGFRDQDVISELHAQEQREHDDMLAQLQSLTTSLDSLDNEAGAGQSRELARLLNDFHEVIANRFGGKQLAASSYLGAARRVQNQALQNLSDMVGIGHSIASLRRQPDNAKLQQQEERLQTLIADNNRLFAALTDTSVTVANIQEIGEFERTETLARLKDLTLLARHKGQ